LCRPVVVGDLAWMERAVALTQTDVSVRRVAHPGELESTPKVMPCLVGSNANLDDVQPGRVSAAAGQAAYDYLCTAIDLTLARAADGIVTAPLHKAGLRAAGLPYPGSVRTL